MSHQVKIRNSIQTEYPVKYLSSWYVLIIFIFPTPHLFQNQESSEDKKIQEVLWLVRALNSNVGSLYEEENKTQLPHYGTCYTSLLLLLDLKDLLLL